MAILRRFRVRRVNTYSTSAAGTENPLSEGARWVNGATLGLDWCDAQTTPGKIFGSQTGTVGATFDDTVAHLLPPSGLIWSTDQDVRARVFITSRVGWNSFKEVECLLRGTMTAHSVKQYEVLFSVVSGTTYIDIVRWNGAVGTVIGDFTFLKSKSDFAGLSDGTYVRATIVGNTITAYTSANGVNWTTELTANILTDSPDGVTYAYGNPGLGFWNREADNGANNTFGFSQWSVTA